MVNIYRVMFVQVGGCSKTHHFSMELLSTSDSTLIPYLNTDPQFIYGFLSFTLSSSSNSLHHTINMSNPDDLKSVFEDPSDIEMEDLSKPNHTLKLKQSS